MTQLFIVLGVLVLSFALRSFQVRFLGKLGALGILAATFLAFYFSTGSIAAGVGGLFIWFLLPWVELLTRVRAMRLPINKELEQKSPPGSSRFPAFSEMTDEVEEEGFEYISDSGWDWDGMNQFYRIFYNEEEREQAAICLTEQDDVSWGCFTLSSRLPDGSIFRTTNVPFSSPMKSAPHVTLRQEPFAEAFGEMLASHRLWINGLGYTSDDFVAEDTGEFLALIEKETDQQIRHNIDLGLIRFAETAETFCYSWKGLFYLYFQLVKDMVKMC